MSKVASNKTILFMPNKYPVGSFKYFETEATMDTVFNFTLDTIKYRKSSDWYKSLFKLIAEYNDKELSENTINLADKMCMIKESHLMRVSLVFDFDTMNIIFYIFDTSGLSDYVKNLLGAEQPQAFQFAFRSIRDDSEFESYLQKVSALCEFIPVDVRDMNLNRSHTGKAIKLYAKLVVSKIDMIGYNKLTRLLEEVLHDDSIEDDSLYYLDINEYKFIKE